MDALTENNYAIFLIYGVHESSAVARPLPCSCCTSGPYCCCSSLSLSLSPIIMDDVASTLLVASAVVFPFPQTAGKTEHRSSLSPRLLPLLLPSLLLLQPGCDAALLPTTVFKVQQPFPSISCSTAALPPLMACSGRGAALGRQGQSPVKGRRRLGGPLPVLKLLLPCCCPPCCCSSLLPGPLGIAAAAVAGSGFTPPVIVD